MILEYLGMVSSCGARLCCPVWAHEKLKVPRPCAAASSFYVRQRQPACPSADLPVIPPINLPDSRPASLPASLPFKAPAETPARRPSVWAVVPCAGSGSRAGTDQPKQYHEVAGAPLVVHTLRALARVPGIRASLAVVAAGDTFLQAWQAQFATLYIADCGGVTRTKSVLNGLNHLATLGADDLDWVLVHDAARCLVTADLVQSLIAACWDDPVGGLLALPLPDTLKSGAEGRVAATIERADKWLAQTPQMFRLGALRAALHTCEASGLAVTDESSAIEAMGLRPLLVPGHAQNFKVTYPPDFALAHSVLQARTMAP